MRRGIEIASVLVILLSLIGTVAIFRSGGHSTAEAPEAVTVPQAAESPSAWSGGGISLSYPDGLCQVSVLQDDASGFRAVVTPPDAAALLPRLEVQRLTAAEVLETPSGAEFQQFAQAVLERYFSGGLSDSAFTAGSAELADGVWQIPLTIAAPDGQTIDARVMLLGSGTTWYLAVSLIPSGAETAADWSAVMDSLAAAE